MKKIKKLILLWIIVEIIFYCFNTVKENEPEELRSYGNEYVREIVIEEEQIQETFIDEIFIQDI